MIPCKQCRHYRLTAWSWLIGGFSGEFATCASPQEFIRDAFAVISRKHDIACGPRARFFEPLPLGRSHGVDWDRARETAETLAEMRAFESKHDQPCDISMFNGKPFLATTIRFRLDETPRSWRARFTVAEYLAALTTDYCRADAAE
jgi:hypothetical protein